MRRCWPVMLLLVVGAASLARPTALVIPSPTNETELVADDGEPYDSFGWSVSLSGDRALIGAIGDDDNGFNAGAAYVFLRTAGGRWTQEAKLLASNEGFDDYFGVSVSISGDTALVGAPNDSVEGVRLGRAYVFVRSGSSWIEQARLVPSDGEFLDQFGEAVSIWGDTALVGAPGKSHPGFDAGAAYVFAREGDVWIQRAKLVSRDLEKGDGFGAAVSLGGDTALIGAPGERENGQNAGAVYVFVREGEDWQERQKLLASDGRAEQAFGVSASLDGSTAVIGASQAVWVHDVGSAYVFEETDGEWIERVELQAVGGKTTHAFGKSVAMSGALALIGDPEDGSTPSPSAMAHLYGSSGSAWIEQATFRSEGGPFYFGTSVALRGERALVGSPQETGIAIGSGVAHVYEPDPIGLSVVGSCPGPVTATVSNAPPNSEVAVIAAGSNHGWVKGGGVCAGTAFEVGEPFQLPPLLIQVDANGSGSGSTLLESSPCWLEALALESCETSSAARVP